MHPFLRVVLLSLLPCACAKQEVQTPATPVEAAAVSTESARVAGSVLPPLPPATQAPQAAPHPSGTQDDKDEPPPSASVFSLSGAPTSPPFVVRSAVVVPSTLPSNISFGDVSIQLFETVVTCAQATGPLAPPHIDTFVSWKPTSQVAFTQI